MNIDKLKHAAKIARDDLCLAMSIPEVKPYNWRLEQAVRLLTDALGDHEDFAKVQARWERESKS